MTSNLERFSPLHAVADALVTWLRATYEVDVEVDLSVGADVLRAPKEITRSVRVTSRNELAAPLTFVYSAFPVVIMHAGLLHDFLFSRLWLRRVRRILGALRR